ncbi:hypothetical protein BB561_003540 [Smittium simulii]|uniref:Probable electron transfer flavoprotein subunit beta n=1 Tax=Smittium simulii TaxID=133385 RepID=A0A2T9YKS5_9FUNG|nr:hypothetical protein BB561_003540 [Smittium simulii]
MKILVGVKRVVDYAVKIRVNSAKTAVETANVKHSINPFDEIAVEEAVRLREKLPKGSVSEIVALSCGPAKCSEVLRTALAMGADRAIHVEVPQNTTLEPLIVAKLFSAVAKKENPSLIIMGKQAIDDDACQTGQMLAGLLDYPQANFVAKLDVADNKVTASCEIDGGLETVECEMPAIITTDLRLNEPRYATLPNIMKAKKKPLDKLTPADLKVDIISKLKVLKVEEPAKRKAGIMVGSVEELIKKLRDEAKVL